MQRDWRSPTNMERFLLKPHISRSKVYGRTNGRVAFLGKAAAGMLASVLALLAPPALLPASTGGKLTKVWALLEHSC